MVKSKSFLQEYKKPIIIIVLLPLAYYIITTFIIPAKKDHSSKSDTANSQTMTNTINSKDSSKPTINATQQQNSNNSIIDNSTKNSIINKQKITIIQPQQRHSTRKDLNKIIKEIPSKNFPVVIMFPSGSKEGLMFAKELERGLIHDKYTNVYSTAHIIYNEKEYKDNRFEIHPMNMGAIDQQVEVWITPLN
jgi:hypothetical protein